MVAAAHLPGILGSRDSRVALPAVSERPHNGSYRAAGNASAMAPSGVQGVLALEVTPLSLPHISAAMSAAVQKSGV